MPGEWNGRRVEIARCPVEKGEVHYHHALTWHGSHANTSNRPAPRHRHPLHDPRDALRSVRTARYETLRGGAGRRADGGGTLPGGLAVDPVPVEVPVLRRVRFGKL